MTSGIGVVVLHCKETTILVFTLLRFFLLFLFVWVEKDALR